MIGLHVLHDQIIRLSAVQDFLQITEPLIGKFHVHSVHDSDLLVHDDIGIVCHAERDNILTFKQVDLMIIDADILDRICNLHKNILHFI